MVSRKNHLIQGYRFLMIKFNWLPLETPIYILQSANQQS